MNPLLKLAAYLARLTPMPVKQWLYRFKPAARLIRAGLNRAAPQGLSETTIAAGGLQGMKLLLDLQQEKDYWLGTYEPELQAAIAAWVKPGAVAYDVGANIGYISLLLAKAVGENGRVVSFEALPSNVDRLRANLALNAEGARVTVVHAAVTADTGPVSFLVGPSGGMGKVAGSAGRQRQYAQSITVPGVSLDDYGISQGNPPPQVVKMDIEGGEVLALPGMRLVLTQARPVVMLELHGPEAAGAAWEELTSAGYSICGMSAGYPPVPALHALDWKAYVIAFPSERAMGHGHA